MAKYKGKYVYTIKEGDIANPYNANTRQFINVHALMQTMGRLMPGDVGKQVFEIDGIYQVENDEQRDARLNA